MTRVRRAYSILLYFRNKMCDATHANTLLTCGLQPMPYMPQTTNLGETIMEIDILTWQLSVKRIKPSSEELIDRYDAIAHQWQRKVQFFRYDRAYASLFARLHDVLHSHFSGYSTADVLDCGVGSGALSVALHNAGHDNLTLRGVDTSPAMVNASRDHVAQQGVPIQVQLQDVRSLPYEDNTFGMVMTAHTIEHLPQPQAAIREMVRVLRPDAPLLIVTTRPGLLGSLVDAQWGLNCLEESMLFAGLVKAGLRDVQTTPLLGAFWCRFLSYAVIGWKTRISVTNGGDTHAWRTRTDDSDWKQDLF